MRTAPPLTRAAWAALAAVLIALRLLAPAGFMPAFERGAATIVLCPDAEPGGAPAVAHHHGHSDKAHAPCPYAAAAGTSALSEPAAALIDIVLLSTLFLLGGAFPFLGRNRTRDRPPPIGPPLSA